MSIPKVSVIIPVYNSEKYIDKCLGSVMSQRYENLEIIVIDDGSTDESLSIINANAEKDSRIKVITQENMGVSAARNAGINEACGDYITFIDSDDYVGQMYIYRMMRCAIKNDSDMVISGLLMQRPDGTVINSVVPRYYKKGEHEEWAFRMSAVACHLYKKELWDKYDIRFHLGVRGEDMPISLFFSYVSRNISVVKHADYYYVQHESSAMHSFKKQDKSFLPYDALEDVMKKVDALGKTEKDNFYELFVLRILATMIDIARGATKEEARTLADYIKRILDTYHPQCYKNPLIKLGSKLDIPFSQKMIVKVLVRAYRMNKIYPLVYSFVRIAG